MLSSLILTTLLAGLIAGPFEPPAPAAQERLSPAWEQLIKQTALGPNGPESLAVRTAAFLATHAPARDSDLDADLLRANLTLAVDARSAHP
ncbi:MAG: hypothetical protein AAGG01_10745, partial [Planctomycetota bacterium]